MYLVFPVIVTLLCIVPTISIGKGFVFFFYPYLYIKYKWSDYSRYLQIYMQMRVEKNTKLLPIINNSA